MKKSYSFTKFVALLFLAAAFLFSSSSWSQNLYVGSNSSGETTNFTTGTNSYVNTYIGYNVGANSNTLNVLNTNTLLANSGSLYIGYYGNGNSMVISNGATVSDVDGYIGYDIAASNNAVLVTGSNSLWNNSGNLHMEGGDTLLITNGGKVVANNYTDSNSATTITIGGVASDINISRLVSLGNSSRLDVRDHSTAEVGSLQSQGRITLGTAAILTITDTNPNSTSTIAGSLNMESGSVLDIAQSGTFTLRGTVSGEDALIIQRRSNIVIINADMSSFSGTITLNEGKTTVASSAKLSSTTTLNVDGGTFTAYGDINNAAVNLTAGEFDIAQAAGASAQHASQLVWRAAGIIGLISSLSDDYTLSTPNILCSDIVFSGDTRNYVNLAASDAYRSRYVLLDNDVTPFLMAPIANIIGTPSFLSTENPTAYNFAAADSVGIRTYSYAINPSADFEVTPGEIAVINPATTFAANRLVLDSGATIDIGANGRASIANDLTFGLWSTLNFTFGCYNNLPLITSGGLITFNPGALIVIETIGSAASYFGGVQRVFTAASFAGKNNLIAAFSNQLIRARKIWIDDPELDILAAPSSYMEVAANQNQVNVAHALDSFIPATSGDNYTVSLALDSLTAAEYPNAFQQISPALYSSLATIAFNTANAQNQGLVQRLGNIRVGGVGFDSMGLGNPIMVNDNKNPKSNGKDVLIPSVDNHWGIFTDANGVFANVNINNQLPGYSSESGGVTLGADYKWNETFSTGIYAGYQGMQSKQSGGNFICDNSSRFGLFGTYQKGGIFANAIVGGDSHSYQIDRTIQFPGLNRTASSAPTAGELDSMLATGYDMRRGKFTFGPTTSLQYTYLGVQPFTEAGAQSLNLNVANENANSLIYSLGSHCFYTWQLNKEVLVVPQINLAWQHEFLQNPYAINSSLQGGGGNFTYMTTTPNRDSLYTGIGFTVNFAKKYDASFFYNASAGNNDLVSQNFFASLGTRF